MVRIKEGWIWLDGWVWADGGVYYHFLLSRIHTVREQELDDENKGRVDMIGWMDMS